jgi:hypothetical protein
MPLGGSGETDQVTYWVDEDTLTGSDDLFWDSSNKYLGVNTGASPRCPLDVIKSGAATETSEADVAVFQSNATVPAKQDAFVRIIAHEDKKAALYFGYAANISLQSIACDNANDEMEITAGKVGCNTASPGARFHVVDDSTGLSTGKFSKDVGSATVPVVEIVQDSTTGGQPCLALGQDDVSEGFVDFLGSDRGGVQTGSTMLNITSAASVRVELNGTVYVIPLFADQ